MSGSVVGNAELELIARDSAPRRAHHRCMKNVRYLVLALALAIPGYAIASHYLGSRHCPSCPMCPDGK